MYLSVKDACFFVVFNLVLSCGVMVVSLCCSNNLNKPLDPFPLSIIGCLLNKKAPRVEVNISLISLAFLYWVGIALHP